MVKDEVVLSSNEIFWLLTMFNLLK